MEGINPIGWTVNWRRDKSDKSDWMDCDWAKGMEAIDSMNGMRMGEGGESRRRDSPRTAAWGKRQRKCAG